MRGAALLLLAAVAGLPAHGLVVGSKNFTESVVLGELLTALVRDSGVAVEHRRGLGGTRLVYNALVAGEIDLYAEYTGTLRYEILAEQRPHDDAALGELLAESGLRATRPLGFANNYALGLPRARAAALGVRTISDLRRHPDLVLRFSNEFMDRADGWPGLRAHYALPQRDVRGVEHDLAYRGLASGGADLTDVYTTDAEIAHYDLLALEDDLTYFPRYEALVLYRAGLEVEATETVASFKRLEGAIDERTMIEMNARVKIDGEPDAAVAADVLRTLFGLDIRVVTETRGRRIVRRTLEHGVLVAVSLTAAVLLALPLGILAARRPRLGQLVLGAVGIAQTIPALALLVFMIPLFGIGAAPAVVALFVYSLLPIVRNTHAGLSGIALSLRESAEALGLPPAARLRLVELPLALPSILAGIKTAAVINVGAATLGALIGAGGYGQPILTGIRLDDVALILEGALPAAAMALAAQGTFDAVERLIVSRGLRV